MPLDSDSDDIVVSSGAPRSTLLRVTATSSERRSFLSFRSRASVVSTTCVPRETAQRALCPLVFGLDPENLSYIDSPEAVEEGERAAKPAVHDNDLRPTSSTSTSSNDTDPARRCAPPDSPRLRRHGGQRSGSRRQQPNAQEARLTRISVSIICLYLFCHIWKLIPTLYESLYGAVDHHQWPLWVEFIKNMSHVLVMFNSAVNFLLYLIL